MFYFKVKIRILVLGFGLRFFFKKGLDLGC